MDTSTQTQSPSGTDEESTGPVVRFPTSQQASKVVDYAKEQSESANTETAGANWGQLERRIQQALLSETLSDELDSQTLASFEGPDSYWSLEIIEDPEDDSYSVVVCDVNGDVVETIAEGVGRFVVGQ